MEVEPSDSSSMRRAELKVQPIDGDDFPGGAGGLCLSRRRRLGAGQFDRWKSQFKDKDGNPPKVETKKVKGKNVEVTRAETSGHYHPAQFPGRPAEPDRDDARLSGAIVVTDKVSYVIKMVGPDKTMTKIRPDFDALLATIKVEE